MSYLLRMDLAGVFDSLNYLDCFIPMMSPQPKHRGKGVRAKPAKRPNRLTVSKRIRRKHRRAS